MNGDLEIKRKNRGGIEIITNKAELSWSRGLNVTVGAEKKHIKKCKYKLEIKRDLGFE